MKQSSIRKAFANQFNVPEDQVKVEFMAFIDGTYEFEVLVNDLDKNQLSTYEFKTTSILRTQLKY